MALLEPSLMDDNVNNDRKIALASFGFVLVVFSIALADKWLLMRPPTWSEQVGLVFGIVVGVFGCLYLQASWDPAALKPKDPDASTATGCWLPIAVIGGTVAARLTTILFSVETNDFIGGCGTSALVLVISYVMIQAWRHRPR